MPISHETIRDLLMPELREVVGEYVNWPPMWQDFVVTRQGFVVTRQGFVDNLYNLPPMTPEQSELASVNNGEDDGIDFPHKWKGV